jgi:hypothetical protein
MRRLRLSLQWIYYGSPEQCTKTANNQQRFHFRTRRQELNSVEGGMYHKSALIQ